MVQSEGALARAHQLKVAPPMMATHLTPQMLRGQLAYRHGQIVNLTHIYKYSTCVKLNQFCCNRPPGCFLARFLSRARPPNRNWLPAGNQVEA